MLTEAYVEPPFRIGRTFDIDGAAYLIVACTGPGLFAGDRLRQCVRVDRGARVLLASQSALQVHPSGAADAPLVAHEYRVADGGELHCHWDPMIPFAGARLTGRVDMQIAGGGRLYWSDALMSGRVSRGETWQFDAIDHELRLACDGVLTYLERYRLAPGERPIARPWVAAEAQYVGTTLVRHPRATPAAAGALQNRLAGVEGVTAGVDLVEPALIVGRWLAATGIGCARVREICRGGILETIFDSPGLLTRR